MISGPWRARFRKRGFKSARRPLRCGHPDRLVTTIDMNHLSRRGPNAVDLVRSLRQPLQDSARNALGMMVAVRCRHPDRVVTTIDMNHLARGGGEIVAEQCAH
jgi:hypothetical protein